jgi:hypothetical protein
MGDVVRKISTERSVGIGVSALTALTVRVVRASRR